MLYSLFSSCADARLCADANNRDPDGWLYKVVRIKAGWVVAAYDEDNVIVGYL